MVLIRHIYILFVSMQFHVCDADVTIDVPAIIIRINDQDISIKLYYISNRAGEVNDATCEWQQTTRKPTFDFYYTHVYVPGDTRITNSVIKLKPGRTLEERNAAGGVVLCTALLDGQLKASKAFTINIHRKPGQASVLQNPASGDILRNSTLIMSCSGDKGNPTGRVTWKINGTVMTDDMYETDEITIYEVQAEHDGDWTCYFTNSLGSGGESKMQTVDVKWQPAPCDLTLNPEDDYINCTKTLQLMCTCPVKGKPMGEIHWSLNMNKKTGIMYQADALSIDSVATEHAGEWGCYYKNEIGMGTPSSKYVNVKCRPTGQPELVSDSVLVKRGQMVKLGCKGDPGSPKDKVLLKLDSNVVGVITAVTENVWNIELSRSGIWSCFFMNEFGNGTESDGVLIGVLCLPSLYVEYVSYAFNESYVHFNLRLNDESATDTVNVQVCSTPHDEPLCSTALSKLKTTELISDVELPEPSDHTLYNVTFIFSHGSRFVSQHGIALRGNEKQSSTSTIFAAVFGALWIITAGIAAVVILLYHRRLKEKDVNPSKEKEAEVHYVNAGAETGTENTT